LHLPLGALGRFRRDARLLILSAGCFALSFYGLQVLLRVLYVLRLGADPTYVGLFSASGAWVYMAMGMPSGALGQRYTPRKVMMVGGVLTIVGMFLLPLAEFMPGAWRMTWPFIANIVLTAGWSMFNVNEVALLMAVTSPEERGSAYSWNGGLRGLGTFLGTVGGGLLPGILAAPLGRTLQDPLPYGASLWVGAVLCLAGMVPLARMKVRSIAPTRAAPTDANKPTAPADPFPWAIMTLIVTHILFSHGGWATVQAFWNAYADTDLALSAASIGAITGGAQFVAMLAAFGTARLAARRSNGWVMIITTLGQGLAMAAAVALPNLAGATIARWGVVVLSAMWLPAMQVYQMEAISERWRSLAYGISSTTMGMAFGAMSVIGGYVIASRGYVSVFGLGAALSVAGAALLAVTLRRTRQTS
jgi:MFS family permease